MSLTCVSSYFPVKNKHNNKYNEWFENTLSINCPYVFFTNKDNIELIKSFRKDLPTYYIECEIEDFYTYKYKNKIITDPIHCPSVELNLIWNEKIFMIQKACEINPFNTIWFMWIGSGISVFRDKKPSNIKFSNEEFIKKLPKNKFIYESSNEYNSDYIVKNNYYHYISGTNYIINKNFINRFVYIYNIYLDKLIDKKNIWTDQVILTHIYKDYPDLFFKLSDGYGKIALNLFE